MSRPPKPIHSVKEFTIEQSVRDKLQLADVLFTSAQNWASIDSCLEDYFILNEYWDSNGHNLFNSLITILDAISNSNWKKSVKSYSQKVSQYFQTSDTKLRFLTQYLDMKRAKDLQKSQRDLNDETEITSNCLVIDHQTSQRQELITSQKVSFLSSDTLKYKLWLISIIVFLIEKEKKDPADLIC